MALVEINDLAAVGLIRDVESHQLPPETWTTADNIRFRDGGAERRGGRAQIFGTPGVAPHFALPVANASQTWWLYTSLTKAYVYDGTTHTDITRAAGGDYSTGATKDWNGTLLGGVPVLNNFADVPQYWASYSTGTKLAALTNWPAANRAKVIRAFGASLIALHLSDSGTVKPHLVRWSHPADPGSVPSSWDITDATKDAGESDLPDVYAGLIREGLPLRGNFYIYKDGSIWRMTFVGGAFKYNFQVFSETAGILSARCVSLTADGTQHIVATQDDVIAHNGNSIQSLLDKRMRRTLFNTIDDDNYVNSFTFTNPFSNEVWFCYPEQGSTNPTRALVWAYKEGQFGALSEKTVDFRNATHGIIESSTSDTWTTVTDTWATTSAQWSQATRRKVVLCGTDATKFYQLDEGTTDAGAAISATLQRVGLSVVGKDRKGNWITDFNSRKFVTRVWITASGGPINVRVGYQNTPDGSVTWSAAKVFAPATDKWVDVAISGVAVAIEFSAAVHFRVSSYKLELDVIGEY